MAPVQGDASCMLSDDVSTLISVKWLALGIMVIRTLPSLPPPPLFGFVWVVEDSGASWSLLLCQRHPTLSVPTVFGSQRPEDLRENGVLGSMGNCSRSTKGILGMGTEAGSDKNRLDVGLYPWVFSSAAVRCSSLGHCVSTQHSSMTEDAG